MSAIFGWPKMLRSGLRLMVVGLKPLLVYGSGGGPGIRGFSLGGGSAIKNRRALRYASLRKSQGSIRSLRSVRKIPLEKRVPELGNAGVQAEVDHGVGLLVLVIARAGLRLPSHRAEKRHHDDGHERKDEQSDEQR